ncbi:hypothetical protein DLM75_19675 [Leptospira stimsonii]|uniref:Uncharacterized protein n=1 Tax=Leptospira stimsonii TaxID=2202203 RepID=A0A396YR98_9LEPT|nr:hypothetical protein DLM75_19675 [Leptospira stimsonii]
MAPKLIFFWKQKGQESFKTYAFVLHTVVFLNDTFIRSLRAQSNHFRNPVQKDSHIEITFHLFN